MGEIRFVGTGETRGYPYLVCKKTIYYSKHIVQTWITTARVLILSSTISVTVSMVVTPIKICWKYRKNSTVNNFESIKEI